MCDFHFSSKGVIFGGPHALTAHKYFIMAEYRSIDNPEKALEHIRNSPSDSAMLEMIVVRPQKNERITPESCSIGLRHGLMGDHWAKGCWKSLPDGSPDPDVQVAIMNSRCLDLITTSRSQWPQAGDNLIVDLDLSVSNLAPGDQLAVGSAVLQITGVPHTGCDKFKERFGIDALQFISTKEGKQLRLRGIYAKIVRDGEIKVGDSIRKIPG